MSSQFLRRSRSIICQMGLSSLAVSRRTEHPCGPLVAMATESAHVAWTVRKRTIGQRQRSETCRYRHRAVLGQPAEHCMSKSRIETDTAKSRCGSRGDKRSFQPMTSSTSRDPPMSQQRRKPYRRHKSSWQRNVYVMWMCSLLVKTLARTIVVATSVTSWMLFAR